MRTTKTDPIIDELHAVRDEHAARFGYDVEAIFQDIRARQAASGRDYVRRQARPIDDQAAHLIDDEATFGYYMAGVFDVLGQSGKLRGQTGLPLNDDPAELKRVVDNLKETAGVVIGFRRMFTNFFEADARPTGLAHSLPPPQRDEMLAAMSSSVMRWCVSDSIFVAVPIGWPRHPAAGVADIFRLLLAAGAMWFAGLYANHPIRGGMEFGTGIDIEPGEIYGQALEAAHHLESRVAGSPRIVVGPKCMDFLKAVKQKQGVSDAGPGMAASMADLCLAMLREDADGNMVIDGLGPVMLKHMAPDFRGAVLRAHDNVRTNCRDFRRAGDTKLASRYETLLAYFDERAPMWRDAR